MIKQILIKSSVGLLILVLGFSSISFAINENSNYVEAYGLDTVAGYSTYLRTSQTNSNAKVIFDVKKPDGSLVEMSSVTDQDGIAKVELSDYYTRTSGVYEVSAKLENGASGAKNFFNIYAGEVSSDVSVVSPSDQVVSSSGDSASITVKLLDEYKNPIEDHIVRLISSSTNDVISSSSDLNITNVDGEVNFSVSSGESSAVTYTAYDSTADKIINSRAKVVYFGSSDYIFSNNVPENYSYAASGNGSSSIDSFKFEELPQSVNVGESATFTISAKDSQDQTVVNYLGTVRFSVIGDNAFYVDLPNDYTFTAQDLGSHKFSLGLLFKQPGSYKIEVRDLSNTSVYGENIFEVVSTGNGVQSNSSILISNPISGTYSNKIQVVSGTSLPNSKLKIFDNDAEIGSVISDSSGNFSYTSGVLADGVHKIYVASVNDIGTIVDSSSVVEISIDASAPDITRVDLEPSSGITPGSVVKVKIYASEDLSQVALIFENNVYDLTKNAQGYYEGSFSAPAANGQYPLSFSIVDQLGNESKLDNKATLNVGGSAVIGDVSGLVAQGSDHRVILTWKAPATAVSPIKNYRIYYGLSPNQLTEAVDTFTNSTTWYLPNLKNGIVYYFAAVAVDDKGNISEHFSNIVTITPNSVTVDVAPPDVTLGSAGGDAIADMKKDASESGPDLWWLVFVALIGGVFYGQTFKKRVMLREKHASYQEILENADDTKKSLQDCLFK